ncbi:NlpC/P60 family protein [Streptomyces sp. NPDC002088]|uniref:NlpC/P60 family protein n=1 Tax=Streptomyces sp. NPDC002088 TaxID=3154665 RepID=UPI003323DFD0
MANQSTAAGQGQLLGWNKAQEAISALTRTITDLNKGLKGVSGGVGQMSQSRSVGLALGDVWNGSSHFSQGRTGGQTSSSNGGSVRFSGSTNQGGGSANNGGQQGSGGSGGSGGTNTPRLGGGSTNNGGQRSQYTLKSGLSGVVSWGQKELPDQVTMQTTAYQAAQYSSKSWHTLRDQAFKNNFTAQSTQDAATAYATMSQQGMSGGTSSFNTQWNYVKGTSGYLNPGMSETQRAQGTAAAWSARTYNTMRGMGIQTIKGGQKQSPRQIAQQIYTRFPALKNVKTQAQLSATLNDPASGLNQSLNSWGLDSNTLELVKGELRGMMLSQIHGGTANTYVSLANQRDNGKTQESKNSAQSSLKKMGIGGSSANTLMTRAGTLRNQDVNINDSFTSGLETATKYLDKFSTALQKVLDVTGANSVMGFTGGAGSLLGSSVGGAIGAYGTMRGLASVGRLGGMMGGAGSGGGLLSGLAGGAGARVAGSGALSLSGAALGTAGAFGVGALATGYVGHKLTKKIDNDTGRKWANVGVDAGAGALTGAAIGSVVPVIGTGIGAAVGGVAGAAWGIGTNFFGGAGESGGAAAATGGKGKSGAKATGTQGAGKTAAAVIKVAMKYLGVPYVWGGTSPKGFDCSGLLQYSFKQIGVSIPRTAAQQQKAGKKVKLSEVRAGDLLFNGNPAHHVVMCIGGGKVIEAPRTGLNVRVRSFKPGEFTNAVRILGSVGNLSDTSSDDTETAGSDTERLSTMGFGGDTGAYGSVEEADALASGMAALATTVGTSKSDETDKSESDSGSSSVGTAPKGNLAKWIKSALTLIHKDTKQNEKYVNTIAMHESGGNPKAINKWDSNAKNGTPSKGIMQTIQPTFDAYSLKGHKDIWNPVDNIIAGTRYAVSRYGSLANVPGIKSMANGGSYKGYAVGSTNVDVDQTARIHKGEMIIPAYQAEAVRQALAGNTPLAGGLGGTSGGSASLAFHSGSVVIQVQGSMDQQSARDAAKQFMTALAEDDRINLIAAGN